MRASILVVFAIVFLLVEVSGCSSPKGELPAGAPVSGTVTMDGKPLAGVTVTFIPVGSTPGDFCLGETDQSGHYELQDRYGEKGAPAGEYKVTCGIEVSADAAPSDAGAGPLPPRYSQEDITELKATVPAGGGTVDFKLSSKP